MTTTSMTFVKIYLILKVRKLN